MELAKLDYTLGSALGEFVSSLEQAFRQDLSSVVVYGPVARGEYQPKTTQVSVLVVVRQLGRTQIRKLVEPVRLARKAILLDPLVFTLEDLRRSTDAFPLRILEIQRNYRVLAGEDLLGAIFVASEHVRLACEREAKTTVLRLRQLYLVRAGLRPAWLETLTETIRPFLRVVSFVLELTGKQVPHLMEDLLTMAEADIGLSKSLLTQVLGLRIGGERLDHKALEEVYEEFLEAASRLASFVDRLSRA